MKKFLCYDTNDAASGKINVDSRGMLKHDLAYETTPVITELIPEQEVDFSGWDAESPINVILVEGCTYIVKLNGIEYECVCKVDEDIKYIGNISIATNHFVPGYPFLYVDSESLWRIAIEEAGVYTLSLSIKQGTIKPIERKYLTNAVRVVSSPEYWTMEEILHYYQEFMRGTVLIMYMPSPCIILSIVPNDSEDGVVVSYVYNGLINKVNVVPTHHGGDV